MDTLIKFGVLIGLIIGLIIVGPLLTIWAWNTLFGNFHEIDYTMANWFAVVILGARFRATATVKKD